MAEIVGAEEGAMGEALVPPAYLSQGGLSRDEVLARMMDPEVMQAESKQRGQESQAVRDGAEMVEALAHGWWKAQHARRWDSPAGDMKWSDISRTVYIEATGALLSSDEFRDWLAERVAAAKAEGAAEAWDLLATEVGKTATQLRPIIDWKSENPFRPELWATPEAATKRADHLRALAADNQTEGER
jgi:hypothetical protein